MTEVHGSVKVGRKIPKKVWYKDVVNAAVERKEAAWREVLGLKDKVAKDGCKKIYNEEKRKVKREYIRDKLEVINSLKGR